MTVIRRSAAPAPRAPARPVARPAPHVQERSVAHISGSIRKGKEVIEEASRQEVMETRQFEPGEHVAYVRVSAGTTHNLQDFNSLRIDVSITLPCRVGEIDEAYAAVSEKVSELHTKEAELWGAP